MLLFLSSRGERDIPPSSPSAVEDIERFKAYSLNMGHASTEITDRFYSKFAKDDVREIVMRIRENRNISRDLDEKLLEEFLEFQNFIMWRDNKRK